MSAFITKQPIDVAAFKALLPPDSDFHSVTFNKETSEIEFRWSNRGLITPFSFDEVFTLEMLQAGILPESVTRRKPIVVSAPPPGPPKSDVDKKPRRGIRKVI